MESAPSDRTLQPGIYKILNDMNPDSSVDLSGYDMKTVIGKSSTNLNITGLTGDTLQRTETTVVKTRRFFMSSDNRDRYLQ